MSLDTEEIEVDESYLGGCGLQYAGHFHLGYGIFHCDLISEV